MNVLGINHLQHALAPRFAPVSPAVRTFVSRVSVVFTVLVALTYCAAIVTVFAHKHNVYVLPVTKVRSVTCGSNAWQRP